MVAVAFALLCAPFALRAQLLHADEPVAAAQDAAERATAEHWYRLLMADQPAGFMHLHQSRDAETQYVTTRSKVDMTIRRGAMTMQMIVTTRWVEAADGRPIETSVVREGAGGAKVEQTLRFGEDGITLLTGQEGRDFVRTLPLPDKEILGPVAQEALLLEHLDTPGATFSYWSYDLSLGLRPVEMRTNIGEREQVDVLGQARQAVSVESMMPIMPHVKTQQWVTADGTLLRMSTQMMPGLTMQLVKAPEQVATGKIQPPELMVRTLIKADKPIRNARELTFAKYRLTIEDADADADADRLPLERLPETAAQRVALDKAGQASAVVTIDLSGDQPEGDEPTADARGSSVLIDPKDEAVLKLVADALGDDRAPTLANARKIEKYVADHIDAKDLSVGMASASEVARMKQGDCTEHAVLLAAMLRAIDIPSRVACGLAYIDWFMGQRNVFGFHMWAQGYVEGKWVDFDAAMGDSGFDATHITIAVDELVSPNAEATSLAIMPLMGRLKIEVLETR